MSKVNDIYNNAELSFAAYADLLEGNVLNQKEKLINADFTSKQAEEFATRYTDVIAVYDDSDNTGFSATVFKSSTDRLTLAIRGTDQLLGADGDDDLDILNNGIAKEQILEMVNWWSRATAQAGTHVTQLAITPYLNGSSSIGGAKFLYSIPNGNSTALNYYLEPVSNAVATGELYGRTDQKLSITGHSLGGHLAMAFGALFASDTESVTVFNAPGFDTNAISQSIFQALGGSIPTGQSTTNVIANQASGDDVPWSGIAGLHSRPGAAVDIAIEDQFGLDSDEPNPAGSRNHSQMILTDSLAVYNMLNELAPSLTASEYSSILGNVTNTTSGSYEGIVDILETLFGLNSTPLATGNNNRNALYEAIYSVQSAASAHIGQLIIQSVASLAEHATADNAQGQAYRYALKNLNPFAITGNADLYSQHNTVGALNSENFSDQYLHDRAQMLAVKNQLFSQDETEEFNADVKADTLYKDITTGLDLRQTTGLSALDIDREQILFGSDASETGFELKGGRKNDHIYGGAGIDQLHGEAGDDDIQGDTITITNGVEVADKQIERLEFFDGELNDRHAA